MEPTNVKICTCLFYIGDNGICPVHGDPNHLARNYTGPRLQVRDERAIQKAARKHGVRALILKADDLSRRQP